MILMRPEDVQRPVSPVGARLAWVLVVQVTSDLARLARLGRLSSCSAPAPL